MFLALKRYRRVLSISSAVLGLGLLASGGLFASIITPTDYSYTNSTPPGEPSTVYVDNGTPNKLIDTDAGTISPTDGSWVGWQTDKAPQITFDFSQSYTITDVFIDFLTNTDANVDLPGSVTIGGTTFPVTDLASDSKGFVDFAVDWTGNQLVVTLNNSGSNWVFVNEVTFSGAAAPEPASFGLILAGLAAAGLVARKRRSAIYRILTATTGSK